MNKNIIITLILLFITIFLFGITALDIIIQNYLFDFQSKEWILNKTQEPYRFIFYTGIKKLLILIVSIFLITFIFLREKEYIKTYKKGILIVILSAIFIPITTGGLKKLTNMPCPKNEIHYGGVYPLTKVWESYPKNFKNFSKKCCWPTGHASGGFALLSLFFLFKSRKNKIRSVITALVIGWSMGLYKMLIGDHFLSHIIITMILAWLIILIIAKFVK